MSLCSKKYASTWVIDCLGHFDQLSSIARLPVDAASADVTGARPKDAVGGGQDELGRDDCAAAKPEKLL